MINPVRGSFYLWTYESIELLHVTRTKQRQFKANSNHRVYRYLYIPAYNTFAVNPVQYTGRVNNWRVCEYASYEISSCVADRVWSELNELWSDSNVVEIVYISTREICIVRRSNETWRKMSNRPGWLINCDNKGSSDSSFVVTYELWSSVSKTAFGGMSVKIRRS